MLKVNVGNIHALFYSKFNIREEVKILSLDQKGIIKDKHYGKKRERSVLITSLESYELSEKNGIDTEYGMLGENILIDYNPYQLKEGTQILIGEVILEISQHCTLCKSLAKVDDKLPMLLKEHRGIFAKVLKEGIVKKDDVIYLLNKEIFQ
jgi:MOSC domain-containing protein YiiM